LRSDKFLTTGNQIMNTPENSQDYANIANGGGAKIVGGGSGSGPGPDVMAAHTLDRNKVVSSDGEDIGHLSEIMLDVRGGRIAYAVLTAGGFLGMGSTLHAIPWSALTLDTEHKCFHLDATAEHVKSAPGFDKDHWPLMADEHLSSSIHEHYNRRPYWVTDRSVEDELPPDL
jgi:sporulation protein YlmC with PRC-barrel domain